MNTFAPEAPGKVRPTPLTPLPQAAGWGRETVPLQNFDRIFHCVGTPEFVRSPFATLESKRESDMTPNTPNPLLASLARLANDEEWKEEDYNGLHRLLKPTHNKHTESKSGDKAGFSLLFQDALHGFLTDQLLSEGKAGLRNILLNAHDDNEAKGRLVIMFKRFLIQGRRNVRSNKRRVVRTILKENYQLHCDCPEIWAPHGVSGPSPFNISFMNKLDKWAREYGPITPVLGSEESTQLPIVVRKETLSHIVEFLFRKARAPLSFDQIFSFVDKVADLAHWEADRNFKGIVRYEPDWKDQEVAGTNSQKNKLSAKPHSKRDKTEAEDEKLSPEERLVMEAQEKDARQFVCSLQPEQIWYLCRRVKDAPIHWNEFQARFGMSRTTFFDKPFRNMKNGLLRLNKSNTEVFDLALHMIACLCGPQGRSVPATPDRKPKKPGHKR